MRDCAEVLQTPYKLDEDDEQDPEDAQAEYFKTTSKALFRSSKALFALDRFKECLDALERLAKHSPPLDLAASQLLDSVRLKLAQQEKYIKAKEAREAKKAAEEQKLVLALRVSLHFSSRSETATCCLSDS